MPEDELAQRRRQRGRPRRRPADKRPPRPPTPDFSVASEAGSETFDMVKHFAVDDNSATPSHTVEQPAETYAETPELAARPAPRTKSRKRGATLGSVLHYLSVGLKSRFSGGGSFVLVDEQAEPGMATAMRAADAATASMSPVLAGAMSGAVRPPRRHRPVASRTARRLRHIAWVPAVVVGLFVAVLVVRAIHPFGPVSTAHRTAATHGASPPAPSHAPAPEKALAQSVTNGTRALSTDVKRLVTAHKNLEARKAKAAKARAARAAKARHRREAARARARRERARHRSRVASATGSGAATADSAPPAETTSHAYTAPQTSPQPTYTQPETTATPATTPSSSSSSGSSSGGSSTSNQTSSGSGGSKAPVGPTIGTAVGCNPSCS